MDLLVETPRFVPVPRVLSLKGNLDGFVDLAPYFDICLLPVDHYPTFLS